MRAQDQIKLIVTMDTNAVIPEYSIENDIKATFKRLSFVNHGFVSVRQIKSIINEIDPLEAEVAAATFPWLSGEDEDQALTLDQYTETLQSMAVYVTVEKFRAILAAVRMKADGLAASVGLSAIAETMEEAEVAAVVENVAETTLEAEPSLSQGIEPTGEANEAEDGEATEEDKAPALKLKEENEEPLKYVHPPGSRAYLEEEVVPTLHRGLLELTAEVERQRIIEASGVAWEEGKYLPQGWRPFSPLRWLACWLMDHSPLLEVSSTVTTEVSTYETLSPQAKAALVFDGLDSQHEGMVHVSSLYNILKLDKDSVLNALNDRLMEDEAALDKENFVSILLGLVDSVNSPYQLDAAVHRVLPKEMLLEMCSSVREKFIYMYLTLDGAQNQYSESLLVEDVLQLAKRMRLGEDTIMQALAAAGKSSMTQLSCADFVDVMTSLVLEEPLDLDNGITAAVHQSKGLPLGLTMQLTINQREMTSPIDEVRPPELAEVVRGLPGFSETSWASTSEVLDRGSEILLVDVRSLAEVEVSCIPGAVHAAAKADNKSPMGWSLLDTAALSASMPSNSSTKVIAYCATGRRSSAVAGALSRLLGTEVHSLCGGILAYYNEGGSVRAPNGVVVQAVHPGGPAYKDLVTRPNAFKLPE
ncbi:hypothetical protein CEUSTIGMA_g5075.t1 [Chlamydomonas eustigma]|uniref:Rhodanese domain-containing protein n=1 Tax=Chlamydomonas eustigma TaxID=1157962 RepID=A0A250X413_9CHLO|nr:hypothetical protein CEUSTIGMA_g5075.t1 [Chlamydomonas eustigma]|eukprot:GAX77632.1 hypothetical protein CEUSTIGMA_g5075.t1 [Chlamydomonas eustigma]